LTAAFAPARAARVGEERSRSRAGLAAPRAARLRRRPFLGPPAAGRPHPPAPSAPRELLRLQGHIGAAAAEEKTLREVVLQALGKAPHLYASDWRRFSSSEQPPIELAQERARFAVEGTRKELAALAGARPDQLVTILADLAEQRSGASDLCLLALDLCPAR
jgi:hypothetical protein